MDRFTKRAKQTLAYVQDEARGFNHSHVGTEHVLLELTGSSKWVIKQAVEAAHSSIITPSAPNTCSSAWSTRART
jgi:ATP-dependent Clp protease ATP-binding subunit ClpA